MKLTFALKLHPAPEQARALQHTLERANNAATAISQTAWDTQTFGQYALHKATYYAIKSEFDLTAQMVVRVLAKVADAYKLDKAKRRTFHPLGSIAYDDRILRYADDSVSIWTIAGRQRISFTCGEREQHLLASRQGESDLVYRAGQFYLYATANVIEPPLDEPDDVLGIDLGIVNIAAASDGQTFAGGQVNGLRKRHAKLRARLQAKGSKSAKRLLKKRRRKEQRFAAQVNHVISKKVVATAKGTHCAIALENLKGIRQRVTVRKAQRRTHHSWSFFDLRQKIEYKARLSGVRVVLVNPRYTSQRCPACRSVAKANRKSQSYFSCVSCGFSGLADTIAAQNIRVLGRAVVNRPDVSALVG